MSPERTLTDVIHELLGRHAHLRLDTLQYSSEHRRFVILQLLLSHLMFMDMGCESFSTEAAIKALRQISAMSKDLADEIEKLAKE